MAPEDQGEKQALHIPFDIELYDSKGRVIPLLINGESVHNVLDIKQDKQTFVFENVEDCSLLLVQVVAVLVV